MKGRLSAFAAALGAELVGADGDFANAAIDTRRITAGTLFFALPGATRDGHEFVAQARDVGAAAAVVTHVQDISIAQLVVEDVADALQRAARLARAGYHGPVVGVTGSNGKTTVKQMIAAVLGEAGSVLATEGNLNNHLGVPLTLMRLDNTADRAVIEMGANHPGEIGQLAAIARPTVGVITNAGWAHLEGFGSREGIAKAKGELFIRLPEDGTAVINFDDDYAGLWKTLAGRRRVIGFGLSAADAEVRAEDVATTEQGSQFTLVVGDQKVSVRLALPGRHNVANALAAAGVAHALGLAPATIAAGLSRMAHVGGRLAISPARFAARLVDDSYNANPGSLAAALDWLATQAGPRWAALGDMGELGEHAPAAHHQAGLDARAAGVGRLFVTGPASRATAEAFGDGASWYADRETLIAALLAELERTTQDAPIVLVKGSRSAGMDQVAAALKQAPAADASGSSRPTSASSPC